MTFSRDISVLPQNFIRPSARTLYVLPQELYTSFRKILTNVWHESKHGSERKQAWFRTEASMDPNGSKHASIRKETIRKRPTFKRKKMIIRWKGVHCRGNIPGLMRNFSRDLHPEVSLKLCPRLASTTWEVADD